MRASDTKVTSALAAMLLLLPAPAAAQGAWRQIGATSAGNTVFVNRASVKTSNGITTATVRVTLAKPGSTPRGPITSTRTVIMLDCAKQTYAVKENTIYHDEKANRIYDHKVIGIPGYGPPIKGGMPDIVLTNLCKK